ncbi:RcpC/CpaB family pilus assembly protein [Salinactinospora qingdaonensis]|uniref:Flp pilus assembly protein RcpC/CpaB domain-containing protein n=1 Tax=Salinactinospora qingdaonensis TaxID=702744 RepID=A0ABP7FPH5_9ACTN
MLTDSPRRGRLRRLRITLLLARHRRALAALCAVAALGCAVLAVRPPAPATVEVVVAAHDHDARQPLEARDVTVAALAREAVPDSAISAERDLTGTWLSAPVRRGEVLTPARLADPPAAAYGPALVAAPVRLADPGAVSLLRPGSRVDVLAAAGEGLALGAARPAATATTVVSDRPVVALPAAEGDTAGPAGDSEALVVVAVTEEEAQRLAGHAAGSRLSVTIRRRARGRCDRRGRRRRTGPRTVRGGRRQRGPPVRL